MKKLFTLIALLGCFLGANAKEIVDAEVDFSRYTDISEWGFPYSWGGSESARARLSIVDGCLHFHSEEATDPTWDCQFFPIGGVDAEPDVTYTLHFKVKGSVADNISMLGFGQTPYGAFAITTDWVEGTVDYVATSGDGNILMQCGGYVGDIDIAYLKITHEGKEERPVEWTELLTNGDAEKSWADLGLADVTFDDQENNFKICAWGKTNQQDPVPAEIVEVDGGHAFIVRATDCVNPEDGASAWDNQFWIEAPRAIKAGEQVKVHFRYKASEAVTTNTQIHHQNPSDYQHYQGVGDINFTTEWQEFDQVVTWTSSNNDETKDTGYSIAFNLNPNVKTAVDFYFDDLSIQEMKLDKGFFVAASNATTGLEYDFDNAIELTLDEELGAYVGTIGTAGKEDTWVNELMISTVRGNDRAFKANTIKITGTITGNDPDEWPDYTEGSNAKIKLPGAGVWTVAVDPDSRQANFMQVEGEELIVKEPLEEIPNTTEVIVKGQERDDLADTTNQDGTVTINEEEGGTGQPWDNQLFIVANRPLAKGEVTIIKFKYKASVDGATSGTQLHGDPGAYMHWNALGSFTFTTEYQDFEKTLTIPAEADGMKSIAFNMAEIKGACDYYITDVVWMTEDKLETLIDTEGAKNFYVKEGAGTAPYIFGTKDEIKGDANADGVVDVADVDFVIEAIGGEYAKAADVNGDGAVDVADVDFIIEQIQ